MSWSTFHCENSDFIIRSIPDDVQFGVKRSCLEDSEVFRDMFCCCDLGFAMAVPNDDDSMLDLDEPAEILTVLLRVLHAPPPPPISLSKKHDRGVTIQICTEPYVRDSVIPLPILPLLFSLADKYVLSDAIVESLRVHLLANAPTYPLQVYGFATRNGLDHVAAKASTYLLHPPLSSYTTEDVKVIPTVEAYHKLVLLHATRVKLLREVLLAEPIFPHGYGACPVHSVQTSLLWQQTQKALADRLDAGTDVGTEMSSVRLASQSCKVCFTACTAAIEMLAYKCRKIPKRIDQVEVHGI